jgi:ribulose kinase
MVPTGTSQATALGAGILAAASVGLYPDVFAAAQAMTSIKPHPFQPDSERQISYDQLYRHIYRNLFPALHSYLDTLADLTGINGEE